MTNLSTIARSVGNKLTTKRQPKALVQAAGILRLRTFDIFDMSGKPTNEQIAQALNLKGRSNDELLEQIEAKLRD